MVPLELVGPELSVDLPLYSLFLVRHAIHDDIHKDGEYDDDDVVTPRRERAAFAEQLIAVAILDAIFFFSPAVFVLFFFPPLFSLKNINKVPFH